jgi:futalosine hydrolase
MYPGAAPGFPGAHLLLDWPFMSPRHRNPDPLALVCAVPLEAEPLLRRLVGAVHGGLGGRPLTAGRLMDTSVIVLVGGMGKTNTAQSLTALLEHRRVRGVVCFGVAGAYPGSGLGTGDLALASEEVYGDEGVQAPGGWVSCEGIGIPLLARGEERRFNRFPLDPVRVGRAEGTLREGGLSVRAGPFVTVSTCSGTAVRGLELETRFGAVCETMESAAAAHVAAHYEVPYLGLRGISNAVEDRDLSRWRLPEAAAAAAAAAAVVSAGWARIEETA